MDIGLQLLKQAIDKLGKAGECLCRDSVRFSRIYDYVYELEIIVKEIEEEARS
jgi:hypothetical protein